jgi:hypothetical protein
MSQLLPTLSGPPSAKPQPRRYDLVRMFRGGPVRRRRLDAVLLAVAAVVVGAAALVGAVAGDTERITSLWTSAEVSGDGSVRVTEVIDYDFGTDSRHGIFRDVPGLPPDAAVTVSSATAPDQFELIDLGSVTRIRIGDPNRTIGGRHRYQIEYRLEEVAAGGKLAWNAIGTGWPVELNDIEIHVAAPFELTGLRCVQGPSGSTEPCEVSQPEPGHLVARIGWLDAGNGATVYGSAGRVLGDAGPLPAPRAGAAPAAGGSPLPPGLLAAAVALLAGAVTSRLLRRGGREQVAAAGPVDTGWGEGGTTARVDAEKLDSPGVTALGPPAGLTPAQGGIVLTERVNDEHKVAWLLSAAIDGYLDIEDHRGHPTLVRRIPAAASPPDPSTVAVLNQAFAGSDRLTLGSYSPEFAAAWERLGNQLADWQRACRLWDPAGDRRRRRALLLGGIAAPLGLVLTFLSGVAVVPAGWAWPAFVAPGAVVAGIGLALAVRAWELRIRTPHGSALWQQVESFRRFLAESGAPQAEAATMSGRIGQYTAWAVALGEADRWSQAVAASTVPPSPTLTRMYDPWTASALSAATAASITEPSSSGGSTGGGGSGGGGGGGGGGSW